MSNIGYWVLFVSGFLYCVVGFLMILVIYKMRKLLNQLFTADDENKKQRQVLQKIACVFCIAYSVRSFGDLLCVGLGYAGDDDAASGDAGPSMVDSLGGYIAVLPPFLYLISEALPQLAILIYH